jgi:CRISPR-associated protein Csc2
MLNLDHFHTAIPQRPMGRYAHIILIRETDSYALFQTDGELNTAQVQAGRVDSNIITRLTMFKRKQTTPERLIGRELLRGYGLISGDEYDKDKKSSVDSNGLPICDYNVRFCMQCPDCITYGFAIGDSGSEKSKIYSDTAYSLTSYETSHEAFTLNAPYESGTMSRHGEVTSRINEQDHVRPQTLFPAVMTFRDPTSATFLYVLNNVLRARRYGAQTTRTGTLTNHVVGIVLADGEIFSNLLFTQTLYDELAARVPIQPATPIAPAVALDAAQGVITGLLTADGVALRQHLFGQELAAMLDDLRERTRTPDGMRELLAAANRDSRVYFDAYIKKASKK